MSIHEASTFLVRCREDGTFREQAYETENPQDFREWTRTAGYHFTSDEIEDAVRSMKLHAADEFEATEVEELGQWYRMLAGPTEGGPASQTCLACPVHGMCDSKTPCE